MRPQIANSNSKKDIPDQMVAEGVTGPAEGTIGEDRGEQREEGAEGRFIGERKLKLRRKDNQPKG